MTKFTQNPFASCWINSKGALIGGFLVPLAICVALNFGLFIIIVHRLHTAAERRRSQKELETTSFSRELRAAVSIFSLLGLAWLFGSLIDTGDPNSSLAFQYLFALFTTLQGLAIFLLQCVTNDRVREEMKPVLSMKAMSSSTGVISVPKPGSKGNSRTKVGDLSSSSFAIMDEESIRKKRDTDDAGGNAVDSTYTNPYSVMNLGHQNTRNAMASTSFGLDGLDGEDLYDPNTTAINDLYGKLNLHDARASHWVCAIRRVDSLILRYYNHVRIKIKTFDGVVLFRTMVCICTLSQFIFLFIILF